MIGTPGWMGAAACKGCDTNRWFPERGEPTDDVKAICRACPVIAECLEYALTTPERAGVWGGTSEKERHRIRRQRQRARRAGRPNAANPDEAQRLHRNGWPTERIAAELGASQRTIQRHVKDGAA